MDSRDLEAVFQLLSIKNHMYTYQIYETYTLPYLPPNQSNDTHGMSKKDRWMYTETSSINVIDKPRRAGSKACKV